MPAAPHASDFVIRHAAWLRLDVGLVALMLACAGCYTPAVTNPPQGAVDATETLDAAAPGTDAAAPGPDVPKLLPAGDPVEVVVNNDYLSKALAVIQTAQKRLDIVQFEAKGGDIIEILVGAVLNAHARGVVVRVLLDDEIESNKTLIEKFKAAGMQAKLDVSSVRTHAKLISSEQAFLLGSTNWSQTSITLNNEANVLVRDDKSRDTLGKWFDALWTSTSKPVKVALSTSKVAAVYSDTGYEAVVGPLLDKAAKRIQLVVYQMNSDTSDPTSPVAKTLARLKAAAKRGVQVQVILDLSGAWSEQGNVLNKEAAALLASYGADVRFDPVDKITHAKFILIDDTFVLGTNNWGYGGFMLYHEAGLRSSEAKPLATLGAYFDKIWATSKAP